MPSLPRLPDGFEWVDAPWGAALRCRPLADVAPHLFSTRQLVLRPGQQPRALSDALGATAVVLVRQVHGREVVVVRDGDAGPMAGDDARVLADALVTNVPGVAIAVKAADCVPLLIADRRCGAVAAVHAGWRGTAARIVVAAVEAMAREYGSRPADLTVAIGPSIGVCCYEVGTDVVDAFAAAGHARHLVDRWFQSPPPRRGSRTRSALHLDVAGANRDQLVLAGVTQAKIHMSRLCTAMHLDVLTSYRVEGSQATRLVAAIRTGV